MVYYFQVLHGIKEVFEIVSSLCEAIGPTYGLTRGLFYHTQVLVAQGQRDKAITALEQCRDKCRTINLTDHAAAAQQIINELSRKDKIASHS